MKIHGKNYSAKELRKRVGNMDQIAGVRTVTLADGNEHPGRAAIIKTGAGLEITVLLDRGLDIAAASFQGKAIGWRSTTGDAAPQYYEAEGLRWLRSYFGGLVTTCGLSRVGAPDTDSANNGQGLHGRISHTPARNICVQQYWEKNKYLLKVTGTMRETSVFGENLTLTRTVQTALGEKKFWIHDVVTNEGFRKTPLMLLYHCNMGWPVLDENSQIIAPSRIVAARDDHARKGQEQWDHMEKPTRNYQEKCYYHDMAPGQDGTVTVAMINDGFSSDTGFGGYVKYNKRELPRFVQWKMMGEQDYVCGLEPCNCGVEGRDIDEEKGLLDYLSPGEQREFHLEFGAVTTREEVEALKKNCRSIKTKYVNSYLDFVTGK
ncbi:MAG: aldose 1-epimerase family protein [Candidatus Hydrogenedentes bacterium]|nr:aldose 1-epimerase family protein [Candidatus Hydrogenedentota bacterium]